MIPILYEKDATAFDNNGIGHLKDTISCKVTEERNGAYTLVLSYPINGNYYEDIVEGSVIKAKANETSELQLFRVYKSSKPMNGVVTFYGNHISYDLSGYPVVALSLSSTTPGAALTAGFTVSPISHPFTAWSDISTAKDIAITKPRSLRNLCGGQEGSALSIWGGEYEFDNFTVKLHSARGSDTGVVINYGKNLTDAKQERNINDTYTHFLPYAVKTVEVKNETGEIIESHEETVTLPEVITVLIDPENIGHNKALVLDITDKFEDGEEISAANLRAYAEAYIASHRLGKPEINITFSFIQIWDSPEYSDFAALERVHICDTVTVKFSKLGIDAKAKIVKTEYDSLAERFIKLEVGDAKSTLADTVSSIEEDIANTQKSVTAGRNAAFVDLNNAIIEATNKITGNSGGYVVLSPTNNPQELLIMNTADKTTATKVWRFNLNGLGYSSSGYSGEYGLALTMDGAIVADFITAGTLRAIDITACTITGGTLNINNKFIVDSEGNAHTEGYIKATSGDIGGCIITEGVLQIPAANITGTLTAAQIDATSLRVSAANIDGALVIGQLPSTVAETSDIPTKVSDLTNDSGFKNETGVITLIDGKITADYIEALGITVAAANITGTLTAAQIDATSLRVSAANIDGALVIGQLPSTVAETSDIPTKVSDLTNDSGFKNETGVITLIDGKITADYIEALGITVAAANITGTLTAAQIDATSLRVSAANIDGALVIGQLPSTVAETSDIPTKVSDLTNDSGFKNETGVITLIDGKITADYIEALGITVAAANITGTLTAAQIDANGITASGIKISGDVTANRGFIGSDPSARWTIGDSGIYYGITSLDSTQRIDGTYIGTDGIRNQKYRSYTFDWGGTSITVTGNREAIIKNGTIFLEDYIDDGANSQSIALSPQSLDFSTFTSEGTSPDIFKIKTGYYSTYKTLAILHENAEIITLMESNATVENLLHGNWKVTGNAAFNQSVYINGDTDIKGKASVTIDSTAYADGFKITRSSAPQSVRLLDLGVGSVTALDISYNPSDPTQLEIWGYNYWGIRIGSGGTNKLEGTWYCNGGLINGSDRKLKNNINNLPTKFETMFDNLKPKTFKYNDGTSGKFHTGFIVDEVQNAMDISGITEKEFAAVCTQNMGTENEVSGLRYEEFIAICINEIQKLKARVSELEG